MTKDNSGLSSEIKDEVDELLRMCPIEQEPSLTLLRTHLLCEYYLERLIMLTLPRGDRLTSKGNLTFFQKVVLVDSFQVIEDRVIQGLKELNKVRNELSHQKDKEITLSDIERIGCSFGEEFIVAKKEQGKNISFILVKTGSLITRSLVVKILFLEKKCQEKNKSS